MYRYVKLCDAIGMYGYAAPSAMHQLCHVLSRISSYSFHASSRIHALQIKAAKEKKKKDKEGKKGKDKEQDKDKDKAVVATASSSGEVADKEQKDGGKKDSKKK